MRIAQVAPLAEAVPPKLYGGTERIVSYLTEELVAMGHEVTLFASGDSITSANLEAVVPVALRLDPESRDPVSPHVLAVTRVVDMLDQFDIVHFHIDHFQLPVMRERDTPYVTTFHGRLDLKELQPLMDAYPRAPFISISDSQRRPLKNVNWAGTILHGLPKDLLPMGQGEGGYLAFLGRISPEKGPDAAIRIARAAGIPLKIAAKVDRRALLMPICWPEPFGLVMIEAMSCGTPVIAFSHGSVPEVIDPGRSGFIVHDEVNAVAAVKRLGELSRHKVRACFEERFTARRMAEDHLALYHGMIAQQRPAVLRAV
ncbi:MAG: glycosyltransferase family 4 protein [Roseomonas mucosa]|nr:glycosyltransferase family 4 protein [Roseomonas mucosa]